MSSYTNIISLFDFSYRCKNKEELQEKIKPLRIFIKNYHRLKKNELFNIYDSIRIHLNVTQIGTKYKNFTNYNGIYPIKIRVNNNEKITLIINRIIILLINTIPDRILIIINENLINLLKEQIINKFGYELNIKIMTLNDYCVKIIRSYSKKITDAKIDNYRCCYDLIKKFKECICKKFKYIIIDDFEFLNDITFGILYEFNKYGCQLNMIEVHNANLKNYIDVEDIINLIDCNGDLMDKNVVLNIDDNYFDYINNNVLDIEIPFKKNNNKYKIVLDTETNGVDKYDDILQLAYIIIDDENNIIKTVNKFIKNRKNKPDVFEKNNITDEMLNNGDNFIDVFTEFIKDMENITDIIGHNIQFDIRMINENIEKYNLIIENIFENVEIICTLNLFRNYVKLNNINVKLNLETMYKVLTNNDLIGAHDALNDINGTFECYKILIK